MRFRLWEDFGECNYCNRKATALFWEQNWFGFKGRQVCEEHKKLLIPRTIRRYEIDFNKGGK